jgi:hypothetical protein
MLFLEISISRYIRATEVRIYHGYNHIYNDSTYYDVLINGNSRALTQYSPKILDTILDMNTYNLGIDGSAINRQIIKFDRFVSLHGYPRYLIQNIDFFTMNKSVGFEKEQYYPYFFIDKQLKQMVDESENYFWADKYLPLYRYIGFNEIVLKHLFSKDTLFKGYLEHDQKYDGSMIEQMTTVQISRDSEMIQEFDKFLHVLSQNGTQVIFVYAPIYHEVIKKCEQADLVYEMYDSIASKHNIPILNYFNDSICFDNKYFYNATHLNKTGAELFTSKLARDLLLIQGF